MVRKLVSTVCRGHPVRFTLFLEIILVLDEVPFTSVLLKEIKAEINDIAKVHAGRYILILHNLL